MADRKKRYKVGYKNPPLHTRFPSGVSGNPGGRQKGHKGLKTDLEAALNTRSTLENKLTGEQEKGRNQQHAINRLVQRAAIGDLKAQSLLFPLILQILGAEDRNQGPRKLSAVDQEILAEILRSRLSDAAELPAEVIDAAAPPLSATDETPDESFGQEDDDDSED